MKLAWDDVDPGYAVVLYTPEHPDEDGTASALTRRFFTKKPEYTETVRDGE